MKILKWAAVAVTALFVAMDLGALPDSDIDVAYRVIGGVLAVIGAVAAIGLATARPWGRAAVIGAGALNAATAVTGLFTDLDGAVIGIVVGGLGAVLGTLATETSAHTVRA
jgi:hypothetical protein